MPKRDPWKATVRGFITLPSLCTREFGVRTGFAALTLAKERRRLGYLAEDEGSEHRLRVQTNHRKSQSAPYRAKFLILYADIVCARAVNKVVKSRCVLEDYRPT